MAEARVRRDRAPEAALQADYVVVGGGNVDKLGELPPARDPAQRERVRRRVSPVGADDVVLAVGAYPEVTAPTTT